ncbi:CapA family protein [Virgibacillus pantothenticus]|uniref:CapA family protein n=1 Tax=Virgibacillus pantothenticus TaxID=1473 RepID=UPI001C226268|nr:CapA family protein [Virgibacillus pantothenticus]MBU8568560.1 CapA family protein [Virgibacillus pantothenticus]MBU8602612.1 CapA family protein [Virgibacillus pantothenticus]MBU8636732.1 CapA family protein [Virgibacillus pantothenticus]MBU8644411.1 CapA family protein [Virgibacillus pantothenticus]MBU8648510.1 CapA family protein [Virgibacillus pantothenticus]
MNRKRRRRKLKKRAWVPIAVILLGIGILIFSITGKESSPSEAKKEKQSPELTEEGVADLSKQAEDILKQVALSGGSTEAVDELHQFISKAHQIQGKDKALKHYLNKLTTCLEAIVSYRKPSTDEKALGKVYPDYLAALEKIKGTNPSLDVKEIDPYDWFYAAAANYEQGQRVPDQITLSMVGDTSFGTYPEAPKHLQFNTVFEKNNGDNQYVFKNSMPWFHSDDYTVINAESAFTTRTDAQDKKWRIKSDPKYAAFLPASGIEAANLANNHTMDYFAAGYEDTLNAFKKHDVAVFNEDIPLTKSINGIETIFLGYDYRYKKSADSYLHHIIQDVQKYKKEDNLVIVNMHWGIEYMEIPATYQTKFGHATIDAGADIIIGHHPHRLQSVEKYNGKYIIYSMGDYAFGADPTLKSRQTAIFRLTFAKENNAIVTKGLRIVPTLENSNGSETENNYQPLPVFGKEAKEIVNELVRISNLIPNGVIEYDYFDPFLDM